jgi:hypothetical protein
MKKNKIMKKIASLTFWFFFIKGLLWLIIPAVIWFFGFKD